MDNEETKAPLPDLVQLVTPNYTGPRIQRYFGGSWSMHLPFAWDLIKKFKPEVFVELGVYRGESYFTFCQSVEENQLSTLCYGVDTWQGDVHTGFYGSEVGWEVEAHNKRYSAFSHLLKMTFNEALSHFADGSIDLLHIDGAHRYEDVKHDFENWVPKLCEHGVILFHDVTGRQRDFGVWRLWKEIARPRASFVFPFGHGLGIWKKEEVSEKDPRFVRKLFLADEEEQQDIVNHYAIAAAAINLKAKLETARLDAITTSLQIFAGRDNIPEEHRLTGCDFTAGKWQRLCVSLPYGTGDGDVPLRFDPGSEPGVIEIEQIVIRCTASNEVLWRAAGVQELSPLIVGGTALVVPNERVFRILNLGADPQVLVPPLGKNASESPLTFEIWMRLNTSAQKMTACFAELQLLERALEERLKLQLRESERQRLSLKNDLRSTEEQRLSLEVALHEHQAELAAYRSELERLEREVWENRVRRADFAARLKERESSIREIQESFVWKAAKPLWKAERHLSRRKAAKPEPAADEIVFALDGPGIWNARPNSVEFTGWCFTRGGPQIVGVRAKIGRKSYFARYGLQRADVAKTAMADAATLSSGFSLRIPVTPETSVIRLEAITHNGPWRLVLEHSLAAPAPPRDRSRSAPTIEPPPPERLDRPIHANGSQPVLYPNVSADEVLPLLGPHIQQHLARTNVAKPIITVITPTFNTAPRWFVEAGASLLNQSFADWEWCLVDDGSQDVQTKRILESLAKAHPNIHVKLSSSQGISAAANEALEMTRGEFVCFLDHDDLLAPEALQAMYDELSQGFDVVYSDEDKLDDNRRLLTEPFFKPDWSPEYFRGAMYVGHLLCLRREFASRVRFDTNFDGVQDFEFMLRVAETGARIGHVPRILYHWRKTPGSIAETSAAKPQAAVLQEKAVNAHLQRVNLPAEARAGSAPHRLKIVPKPRSSSPKISIIVPTRDSPDLLARCLKSLFETTAYPNYEVILVDNDTGDAQALELMRHYPVTRIYLPNPFNFSRANNLAARRADGEYLVFLNNDTKVISREWLDHLLYYAEQRDVGAVGALLLHDDGSVQHAGVILGMRGTADHSMRGFRAKSDGYAGSLSCAREVSAVTAACMAVRKSTFFEVGEFYEHFFTIYQDLDFCLRLRERGLRIIWTPQAVLLHHESLSRQSYYDEVDRYLLLDQWEEVIQRGDPYYNRNLNVERGDYSLAPER